MKKGLAPSLLDILENRLKHGLRLTKNLRQKQQRYISLTDSSSLKSPFIACILSVIPGVGQMYLGQKKKGILMLVTVYPLYIITIPFGMIDAYILGRRIRNGNAITPWECFWNRRKITKVIWEVIDLVKKGRNEEYSGSEERIIDNSQNSTKTTRDMVVTKEWSYDCTIEHEKVHSEIDTKNIQIKDSVTKSNSIEDSIRKRLEYSYGEKHIYEENIHTEVPPLKKIKLIIKWKHIIETGLVMLKNQNEDIIEIPFERVVGVTFDQVLIGD